MLRRPAPASEDAPEMPPSTPPRELKAVSPPRQLWQRVFYAPLRGPLDWVMRRAIQAQVPA